MHAPTMLTREPSLSFLLVGEGAGEKRAEMGESSRAASSRGRQQPGNRGKLKRVSEHYGNGTLTVSRANWGLFSNGRRAGG